MTPHRPTLLLAALGALSATASAAAVDTSQWKCETCPYPKGTTAVVEVGVGGVDQASNRFGDHTGLQRKGAFAVLGGSLSQRSDNGYFAELIASDLGIDARSLSARSGREGLYALHLGYAETPRHFTDGAATPFIGVGGATLTLPAGYPADSTPNMPLAATLQPVDLGFKARRFDVGGTLIGGERWTYSVNLRRDTRDGTRPGSGSFFSSAAQFAAPVNHTTDQLEVMAAYAQPGLQGTVAYQVSLFRNDDRVLTWDNPFNAVVAGATRGQLALAPDNQFHQIGGTVGYDITPNIRASANIAVGRSTQDAAFAPATLNAALATALPAGSLDGLVDTFNASARVTAAVLPALRLQASYARDVRDNRTAVQSYTVIDTDMFVGATRSNTPFTFKQDRLKLGADYRGPASWKFSGGIDQDNIERNYSEVVTTRETTVWGRAAVSPRDDLSLALKLAHAERDHTTYGTAIWFGLPENPLLRKYNLADRRRDSVSLRADFNLNERVTLGASMDYADDHYGESVVGLTAARDFSLGADLSAALNERTQVTAYVQTERLRSRQGGSQQGAAADWFASDEDRLSVLGIGIRHAAIVDKLDIGADLSRSRSRSNILVQATISDPAFPTARTSIDSVRLFATYKLNENTWLTGHLAHETYKTQDWQLDGVLPATVSNLLAFGTLAPRYELNVLRVAMRVRF